MRRSVALLIFDDVEVLDFAGPFEVFAVTDELGDYERFAVHTVGLTREPIRARNGLTVIPDHDLNSCPPSEILIVPGGAGTRALLNQPATLDWVRRRSLAAEITLSVCTGSLVLAQAGLVDGLTVTTHHECLEALAKLAPEATVDPSRRWHDNGSIVTAAGISAGIDASLHIIDRLHGPEVTQATKNYMEYSGS